MSTIARSRKSSGKGKGVRRRRLDPALLERARKIAESYQVVMWFEDGEWYGRGLELPLTMDDGKTPDECMAKMRAAMASTVAVMLEDGLAVPPPASDNIRNEQVNLRVTSYEKLRLEAAAGADGISDFVRTAALAAAGR